MNKYSSKAVKTAATIGMSLAMVLSNAAPVFATYSKPAEGICKNDAAEKDCGASVYVAVMGALDGTKFGDVTIESDIKIADVEGKQVNILKAISISAYTDALTAFAGEASLGYTEKANISTWKGVVSALETYLGAGSLIDEEVKAGSPLDTLLKNIYNEVGATDWSTVNDGNYSDVKAAFEKLKTFKKNYGKYLGIVSNDDYASNELASAVMDAYTTTNENINEYLGNTADSDLSNFVLAFDAILQNDLDEKTTDLSKKVSNDKDAKKIGEILGGEGKAVTTLSPESVKLNSKSDINKRIKMIKDHDYYDRFKDEDAVIAILDAYQEILDGIGANSDVLKSDAYNDFIKTKVESTTKIDGSSKVTLKTFTKSFKKAKNEDNANDLADVLNSDQWVILKAAKEDVIDAIYTMETRKVGNYYVDKSDYTANSTTAQRNTFDNTFPEYLTALVDKEKGLFGYDVVEKRMNEVADALEAVTTAIEKLTPANIKATDKKTLEAAEDAIYELTKDGTYENNLTKAEGKAVRAAETKIENLREAFDNLGTTAVAGWYDMGNGNWGYNNEDGTPAAYKWVASGSDWYMIKDGKMLRNTWLATDGGRWYYLDNAGKMVTNQSVDGCWINSYGVYMSPSYNG